jgi:hypothetical protein
MDHYLMLLMVNAFALLIINSRRSRLELDAIEADPGGVGPNSKVGPAIPRHAQIFSAM